MCTVSLRCRIITTGFLLALISGSGLGEAKAGLGIIITDTTLMPVGDPLTQYDFKLSLVVGNQLLQGDNITLLNIADYNGTASYVFTSGGIDYSKFFSISTSAGSSAGLTNIELQLTASPGSLTNTTASNEPIGDLFVVTSDQFPPPSNSPLFNPITYTTQTHLFPGGTLNFGQGTTTPTALVPEPSSLALLGVGVGVASGLVLARRRRRLACPA